VFISRHLDPSAPGGRDADVEERPAAALRAAIETPLPPVARDELTQGTEVAR